MSKQIKRAVDAGFAYLDATKGPEWARKINTETLDVRNPCSCVLGQVEECNYSSAISRLGIKNGKLLGFNLRTAAAQSWSTLNALWRRRIRARQRQLDHSGG